MLRQARWLLGYVCFRFEDGFPEDFLNACYQKKYNISRVEKQEGYLVGRCPVGLVPLLRETAAENGGRLTVLKQCGGIFYFARVKNRTGLFVGAVLGLLLLSFLSGFIWHIEVTGNETLNQKEILSFLEKNGFHEGVWARSTDPDTLANLLLASFDEIAWAHINRTGTYARVEIGESVLAPATVDPTRYGNLKAKKDGVLIKATVWDGWQQAAAGDAVVKGDLLISGVGENENGENCFVHARGEYIALVEEPLLVTVSRRQEYQEYTAASVYKNLYVFGLRLPPFGHGRGKNCEVTTRSSYLRLNGRRLPLGIQTVGVREYTVRERELSDSELTALARQETEKKLAALSDDGEIIKKKLKTKLTADGAEVRGKVLCRENIGEEIPLQPDN